MEATKKEPGIVQLVIVLGAITLFCALLLGVINGVTAPQIEQNQIKTRELAMQELLPEATEFALVDDVEGKSEEISNMYEAKANGASVGFAVEVMPKGFGGAIKMIVGIKANGEIAGAKVTAHSETPGLGAKAQADPNWITQFAGKRANGSLAVTKDGGEINAITGATITSRAVVRGVNLAAAYSGAHRNGQAFDATSMATS